MARVVANGAKRSKLDDLEAFRRKLSHVSQSALFEMIRLTRQEGLPELGDRHDEFREARDIQLTKETPYGPIAQSRELTTHGGGTYDVDLVHPLAFFGP